MKIKRQPTDRVQLKLRVRENLRRKLEQAASRKDWSLNAEAASRLEASFEAERLGSLEYRLRALEQARSSPAEA